MNTAPPGNSGSLLASLGLLLALSVCAPIVAYFIIPDEVVERGRADRAFYSLQNELRSSVEELTRLALVTHISSVRGAKAPPAQSTDGMDLVFRLSLVSPPAIKMHMGRAVKSAAASLEARALTDRLTQKVEAFLLAPGSPAALEGVLLTSEQLLRFSARASELRSEASTPGGEGARGMLFALLAGIGWTGFRIAGSTRRNLQAREEAEERLRLALQAAGQGLYDLQRAERVAHLGHFAFDADGSNPVWSESMKEIFGFAASDNPPFDAFPPRLHAEDRDRIMAEFGRRVEAKQGFEFEYRVVRPDGSEVVAHSLGEPTINEANGQLRYFGTTLEVTERKRTEDALRASEARLREAQRTARIGNWDLDLRTKELFWSDEVFSILEMDATNSQASYAAFLEATHPDDREAVDTAYTNSLRQGEAYRIIHRVRMRDGRIKHLEGQCHNEFGPDGTPSRSHGTVQDVTELALADETIRRSLREKETLLREIHHRVKNNLQIISSLLHFQGKKARDPVAAALFEDARQRLRSMTLVHEELYGSKDLADIDFHDYLKSLANQMARSTGPSGRAFPLAIEVEPLRLPMESALPCGMILVELLTNVFKYAYPGREGGQVSIRLERGQGEARFTVGDRGVGFPPDFNPESAGSFGWELIHNLTNQIQGAWTIGPGPGAWVTVSFPLAERASLAAAPLEA